MGGWLQSPKSPPVSHKLWQQVTLQSSVELNNNSNHSNSSVGQFTAWLKGIKISSFRRKEVADNI